MIFDTDEPKEFLKFAEKCEASRYRLYFVKHEDSMLLRPTKSSKNLDSMIYNGKIDESFKKELKEKFQLFEVNKITMIRE